MGLLAKTLVYQYKFDKEDIAEWMCIIEHGNDRDYELLMNNENPAHGLLQIPDLWCEDNGQARHPNICQKPCTAYEDESLADDAECAKHIFKKTEDVTGNGFTAWRGWKSSCRERRSKNIIAECFEEDTTAYPD